MRLASGMFAETADGGRPDCGGGTKVNKFSCEILETALSTKVIILAAFLLFTLSKDGFEDLGSDGDAFVSLIVVAIFLSPSFC